MLLGVLWLLREVGLFSNALSALLCLSAVLSLTRRALDVARRRVRLDVYRRPREHLPHLATMLLRFVAPLAFAWAADLAFVPAQFSDREALEYRVLVWVAAALLALSALAPRERAWAISDALFAAVLGFVSFDLVRASVEPGTADAVQIVSPFDTDALVMHGGASRLLNHHAALAQQAWALDLLPLTPDGKFWSGDKQRLESYPCFGAVLTSPVSGRVAHVRSDRPDMPIGQMDTEAITGNSISIEAAAGRYVVLAHLQAGSVRVTEGQHVAAGEPIARCGNSGHTTLPHLHLQAQSAPVLSNEDRQLRTYPLQLIEAERERGGSVAPAPFTVRRNDVIRPSRRHP
jgi:hypothetical protein